ncbi:uroporphyrinogen decarboxylase family protein [Planctomycetota bacterium]
MNSRERVLAAINHREPDRVPVDLGGTRQSGIAASTYDQLKSQLGISTPTRVYDVYQMLAEVERPVMERFGADVIGLNRPAVAFGIVNADWKPWRLFDGTAVEVPGGFEPITEENGDLVLMRDGATIARMPKDGYYFDRLEVYPGGSQTPVEDVNPPVMSDELCDHYAVAAESLYENTDFAIVAPLGPPYELFYGLGTGGFETWMMALAAEPDYVNSLCEKLVDIWLENLQRFSQAVGNHVQILQVNDDLGTQDAPFISTKMFRELIMPHYKRGLDWVHANTKMKVFLHSDGAIAPLIPSLIEMGVDILDPVQTSARGMDARALKDEFGEQLVFWGGSLDCQKTLPFGTPEEVVQEVQEHVRLFAPGGGYVFAPVHNIQANVPPENVIAMFDAV